MAYVQVEADDQRLEEGPERLQFKSFLGADANAPTAPQNEGVGRTDRRYLSEEGGKSSFWQIEYYQPYFDVDTKTVVKRCYTTLIPTQASTYLSVHLNPADLYGPFWTLTTLIFALFLSSSLGASIADYLSTGGLPYDYNFQLLSIAVSLVYAYGLALPVVLWMALRYLGVGEWSVVEAVALWGYAQFVWIPVAVLCVIPVPLVRWSLVILAFLSSGWFLAANIYPILASAEAKATRLIIIILSVIHLGIAIVFLRMFFNYYVVDKIGMDPLPGTPPPTEPLPGGNMTARWF